MAVVLLTACSEKPPPNVLLVSLDTLRADHLGSYGYERETSPNLDRRGAAGAVFLEARSTAPWTLPAHASLLTGLYPSSHGAVQPPSVLGRGTPTLARVLGEAGFQSAAIVGMSTVQRLVGDFDEVQMISPSGTGIAPKLAALALEWLARRDRARPFLLFLHIPDVHSDYYPRNEFRREFLEPYSGSVEGRTIELSRIRMGRAEPLDARDARHLVNLYDAGIRQLDFDLEVFFAAAEAAGDLANTLVVVTADHGEEFLEHGGVLHGHSLHPELLHVPLFVWGPEVPAGLRLASPVSLVDVMPTLISGLGLPAADGIEGVDLWPGLSREGSGSPDRPLFAATDSWLAQPAGSYLRGVRLGRFALVEDHRSRVALYDLAVDPGQHRDVAGQHPALVGALRDVLSRGRSKTAPSVVPLREAELEELRSLGYLE